MTEFCKQIEAVIELEFEAKKADES